MTDTERLQKMSDEELKSIWKAIWELDRFSRAELTEEWQEDVYAELSHRGITGIVSAWEA